ncbi:MAG: hypothetical protein AB7K68_02260 [Bacteriovoracia bacterium]
MQIAALPEARSFNHLRFLELAQYYCDLLSREGIPALPWQDSSLPHFNRLEGNRQIALLKCLESQINVVSEALQNRGSLLDSWSLIWSFLKEMNFVPSSDLLNHITPDDYIAVYNLQHSMLFLSPNHLKLMSYSLEDLYCRSWMEIFTRDERITKVLMERAISFGQGKRRQTLSNEDVPPHFLAENQSPGMRIATCRSKAYSPIFQNGVPVGYISVNQTTASVSRVMPRPSV